MMRSVYTTLALAVLSSVHAMPLDKRINQVIADSLTSWEQACDTAGGGQQCNALKIKAFDTLLAGADVCAQQDFSDQMIDLAHTLNSDAEMIRLTQIFRQQPRNAPDSLSVLYCQKAPRNQELAGFFQCQFQGVNDSLFTGNLAAGANGTAPPGQSSISPPGSCPANTGGKISDGVQLITLTQNPGTPSDGGNGGGSSQSSAQAPSSATSSDTASQVSPSSAVAPPPPAATTAASTASGFQKDNGLKAQQQNKEFAALDANSSCTEGTNACINQQFAQCVNGKFALQSCGTGVECVALPLVNSPGTSVTCARPSDTTARFAAAGVTGGFDGQQQ